MALDLALREIADAVKQEASTVLHDRQNVIYIGVALGALVLLSLMVGSLAMGFALLCGGLAIAYGVWSVRWVLAQPEGNERMRDIAAAVQQGASATSTASTRQSVKWAGCCFCLSRLPCGLLPLG